MLLCYIFVTKAITFKTKLIHFRHETGRDQKIYVISYVRLYLCPKIICEICERENTITQQHKFSIL